MYISKAASWPKGQPAHKPAEHFPALECRGLAQVRSNTLRIKRVLGCLQSAPDGLGPRASEDFARG